MRLVWSDLVAHARVWAGVLAVTTVTGFVGGIAAGLIETGIVHGGRVQDGLSSTSVAVILFTAVTALVVLGSTARLTIALQRRGYALWQLVGIRPALVVLVVLAQLAIVGALGALAGCLIALPAFPPLFAWAFREWSAMQGIGLHLGPAGVLVVVAAITVVVLLGGLRGARDAGRTPPIEALRDAEPPRIRVGWVRIVVTVLALGGTIALAANLDGDASISAFSGQAVLLTPLIAATLAAAGPFVFPHVLRAWTSLLPAEASASWFLARHTARHRLSRSSAAIGPLMVAIALAGGLYTTGATLAAAQAARTGRNTGFDLAPEGVVILLGGPLLLSAVAAAATVFMSGHAREHEIALVRAAGAAHATILRTALWEAVVYTGTALILATAAVTAGGLVIAAALSLPFPVVAFPTIAAVALGGFALILTATVAPTATALRRDVARTLAGA